jgi:prolyl-tRNA editing enzyme YbaK/EbsC (Cys-tRNA(Pro) deacylase)
MTEPVLLSSIDLQEYLDEHQIPGKIVFLDAMTKTVVQAAFALKASPQQIIKSMVFLIDEKPVIAIICNTVPVNKRLVRKYFGVSKRLVRLAKAEDVRLLTGYKVGTVPPFGHLEKIKTIIDPSVLESHTVYGGGGDYTSMIRIESTALLNHTQAEIVRLN